MEFLIVIFPMLNDQYRFDRTVENCKEENATILYVVYG